MNFCKSCITAREKFRIGDQVILSTEGCVQLPEMISKKFSGKVVGFGRGFNLVRVLIKNLVKPQTFHAGFWERRP